MASGEMKMELRTRGYWRLKAARPLLLLVRWLIEGMHMEWRMGAGRWRPMDERFHIDIEAEWRKPGADDDDLVEPPDRSLWQDVPESRFGDFER